MPAWLLIAGGFLAAYWISGKVGSPPKPGAPQANPQQQTGAAGGPSAKPLTAARKSAVSVFDGLVKWYGLDEETKVEKRD